MENLDTKTLPVLLDMKVEITVRLGTCQLPMREMLILSPDTVVQLDQRANDPVGIYINGTLLARGDVVVVEDHFGVKILELIEPKDA